MNSPTNKPNRLIQASSPYLLQHAHNPVDWFEWGTEALTKAQAEDKPILVSIGYSSCHWCHVMERECFENAHIASLMNAYFVCIKVDREERPDIDQVYMEAVQAMGITGGWPLNVFLTPDQKPFFGGTYFPPASWTQVLTNIQRAFQSRRQEINESADELTRILSAPETSRFFSGKKEDTAFKEGLQLMYRNLETKFDTTEGGLEKAPKFILPSIWLWLLRYHHITGYTDVLHQLDLTLKKIYCGGIYDHLGGGFARYSVDARWFAPHFEKMLYDNAQLLSLYSEAYQVFNNPDFKQAVYETIGWVQGEMTNKQGGFYSALDADSEGVEGKFYVWTYREFTDVAGEHAKEIAGFYNLTAEGNWEHGLNILFRNTGKPRPYGLEEARKNLLNHRNKRIRPALDNKILSSWNALMVSGLTDSYHAFGELRFLDCALSAIRFIEDNLIENTTLFRSWNTRRSPTEGFLEDYACLIQAYLKLYEANFNEMWLKKAELFTQKVLTDFYDPSDGYFFYSGKNAKQLIARKKELFDNVLPSSNSIVALNLWQLGTLLDREEWKAITRNMISGLGHLLHSEPNYMSNWGIVYTWVHHRNAEVAFIGPDCIELKNKFKKKYFPYCLVLGSVEESNLPLLSGKRPIEHKTTIFVCFNKSCRQPVFTVEQALDQLERN